MIETIPDFPLKVSDGFVNILHKAEALTGRPFVFVIDEWDCIFREMKDDSKSQRDYCGFLRDLLKNNSYVALAYMTGILPIKHSALDFFDEHTASRPAMYGEFLGFTTEETQAVCLANSMPFDEISDWYNGYLAKGVGRVFNPLSVVNACLERECQPYWAHTETFEALGMYIRLDFEGLHDAILRLLAGARAKVDTHTFQNDMTTFRSRDDVLTLLIHLGYLGYDEKKSEVFIPNKEISLHFIAAMKNSPEWGEAAKAIESLQECRQER